MTVETVEGLKKIDVTVSAGSEPGTSDLTGGPAAMSFVFGVGSEGLTPFEYSLAGKRPGDEVQVFVAPGSVGEVFCHLNSELPPIAKKDAPFYVTARVDGVAPADSREVVQAMARISQCGGADGCGCGCGSH